MVLPRRYRTLVPTVSQTSDNEEGGENLLTKECLRSYTSNWNLIHYKYSAYSGTYLELPKYVLMFLVIYIYIYIILTNIIVSLYA